MSLAIALKGPEGIVLAADSRVTLTTTQPIPIPGSPTAILPSTFDNATKLLKVAGVEHVAAVTYGTGAIGLEEPRTAHSLLPEFEARLDQKRRLSVQEFAVKLSEFFATQWAERMPKLPAGAVAPMAFLVGGFNEKEPYGQIFDFYIPDRPSPMQLHAAGFGIQWGGQQEITSRIVIGYDPALVEIVRKKFSLDDKATQDLRIEFERVSGAKIPYQFLPLQDCVDLCILLIRTTSQLLNFQTSLRGVGGAIDVATITRQEGFRYVQHKEIRGRSDNT